MPARFVCLANSFKEGGRCLAGIELNTSNNPVFQNARPKWMRPVCNTTHHEVPTHLVSHLRVLNIIELDVTVVQQEGYQSENVFFKENSLRVVGDFNRNNLPNLCENQRFIFGNRGKAVSEDAIGNLNHSLMLISVNEFEVIQKVYDDAPNRPQTRMVFKYNNNQYDFPVTDPAFLHRYQSNPDFMENVNQIYLSLSLGINWQNWYYKLIAAIIY